MARRRCCPVDLVAGVLRAARRRRRSGIGIDLDERAHHPNRGSFGVSDDKSRARLPSPRLAWSTALPARPMTSPSMAATPRSGWSSGWMVDKRGNVRSKRGTSRPSAASGRRVHPQSFEEETLASRSRSDEDGHVLRQFLPPLACGWRCPFPVSLDLVEAVPLLGRDRTPCGGWSTLRRRGGRLARAQRVVDGGLAGPPEHVSGDLLEGGGGSGQGPLGFGPRCICRASRRGVVVRATFAQDVRGGNGYGRVLPGMDPTRPSTSPTSSSARRTAVRSAAKCGTRLAARSTDAGRGERRTPLDPIASRRPGVVPAQRCRPTRLRQGRLMA